MKDYANFGIHISNTVTRRHDIASYYILSAIAAKQALHSAVQAQNSYAQIPGPLVGSHG